MTKAEIDQLKSRAGSARSSCSALASMLTPMQSETANSHLANIGGFLRNVENALTQAGDAIAEAPPQG